MLLLNDTLSLSDFEILNVKELKVKLEVREGWRTGQAEQVTKQAEQIINKYAD